MQYSIEQLKFPSLNVPIDTHRPEVQASATFILNQLRSTYPAITSHQLSDLHPKKHRPFFTQQIFLQGQLKHIISMLERKTDLGKIRQAHRFQLFMKKLTCVAGTLEMIGEVINLPNLSHESLLFVFKELQRLVHKYTVSRTWTVNDEHWSRDLYYDHEKRIQVAVKATPAELLNLVCTALLDSSHYPGKEQINKEKNNNVAKFTIMLYRNAREQQRGNFEKCATGHKHDLLTLLDRAYIDQHGNLIELIMDIPSFLHQNLSEILEQALRSLPPVQRYDFLLSWIRAFYETDSLPDLIMLEPLRQNILGALITRIQQKGLIVSQDSIDVIINNWMYVPIPVTDPTIHLLTLLFQIKPALGEPALLALKSRLSGDYLAALEQNAHIPSLKAFYDLLLKTTFLNKYESLVPFRALEKQIISTRDALKQQLERYFRSVCELKDDFPASSVDLNASLQSFSTQLQALEKDKHIMALVQTFFSAVKNEPQCLKLIKDCFKNPPEQNPLFVDDAILSDWFTTYTNRDHITEISAYEINRIFINAMFNPDHRWSSVFQDALCLITCWLFENKQSKHHSIRALAAVYPVALLQQLHLLSRLPESIRMKAFERRTRLEDGESFDKPMYGLHLLNDLNSDECFTVLSIIESYLHWFEMGIDEHTWTNCLKLSLLKLLLQHKQAYTEQQHELIIHILQQLQQPNLPIAEVIEILEDRNLSEKQWETTFNLMQHKYLPYLSDLQGLIANRSFSHQRRNSIYQIILSRVNEEKLLIADSDMVSLLSSQEFMSDQHNYLFDSVLRHLRTHCYNGYYLFRLLSIPTLLPHELDDILSTFKRQNPITTTQLTQLLSIEKLTLLQKRNLFSHYADHISHIDQITELLSQSLWSTKELDVIMQALLPHLPRLIQKESHLQYVNKIKNLIPEQRDKLHLTLLPIYGNLLNDVPGMPYAVNLLVDKALDAEVIEQLFITLRTSKFTENGSIRSLLSNKDLSPSQFEVIWQIAKPKLDVIITNPLHFRSLIEKQGMSPDYYASLWQFIKPRLARWMTNGFRFNELGSTLQFNINPDFLDLFWQTAKSCSDNWLHSAEDLVYLLSDSNQIPDSLEAIWAIAKPKLTNLTNEIRSVVTLFSVQVTQIPDYYKTLWNVAKPKLTTLGRINILVGFFTRSIPILGDHSILWQQLEPKLKELEYFQLEQLLESVQVTPPQRQQLIPFIKNKLSSSIRADNIKWLSREERASIWPRLMKKDFPSFHWIENMLALPDLTLDEQQQVLACINRSCTHILHLVGYLESTVKQQICTMILQKIMPYLLKNGADYLSDLICCDNLNHENKNIIIKAFAATLKENVSHHISIDVFTKRKLTPDQISLLVQTAGVNVQIWMKDAKMIEFFLSIEEPELQARIFEIACIKLKTCLYFPQQLISLLSLKTLSTAQQNILWEFYPVIHSQMQTVDFLAMLSIPTINAELQTRIRRQHPWDKVIKNATQLCAFLSLPHLSSSDREDLITILAPKLCDIIIYCSELTQLVSIPYLTDAQRDCFLEIYASNREKAPLSPFRLATLLAVETLTSKQKNFITDNITHQKSQQPLALNFKLSFFSNQVGLELKDGSAPLASRSLS